MPKLKINNSFDQLFIFSIITPHNDLKVAWLLNQYLNLNLSRTDSIYHKNGLPEEGFAVFIYDNENYDVFCRYILLQNRRKNYSFFTSHAKVDYFFVLMGSFFDEEIAQIKSSLKKINDFQTVFTVKPTTIKGIEVLFQFE